MNAVWGTALNLELNVGHIAEYTIDTAGEATLISDTELSYCNETAEISVAPDCSVLGVLCRSTMEVFTSTGFVERGPSCHALALSCMAFLVCILNPLRCLEAADIGAKDYVTENKNRGRDLWVRLLASRKL